MITNTPPLKRRMLFSLVLAAFLIMAGMCTTASAAETTSTGSPEAQVAIMDVTLDPAIFMQDDTGTLTVRIQNSGTAPVSINRVEILSSDIQVANYQTYDKVGTLGAGNALTFTFLLNAGAKDGTFFPLFYIDFTNAGSTRYPVPVRVDNTGVLVSVVKSPDLFAAGARDEITLSVSNPRDNEVNSVTIVPHGEGITVSQSAIFIGTIRSDEERQVTFGITPEVQTDLICDITYRNGPNLHRTTLAVPVTFGDRRVSAELVVNNVNVRGTGSALTISGDVTNAGLKDARSVMVTVGEPARGVDPNPVYVIGALEPDDFSSFEVNAAVQGTGVIPLVISYKDDEGRTFQERFEVSMQNRLAESSESSPVQQGSAGSNVRRPGGFFTFGGGMGQVPVIPIIVVILAGLAGIVAWRKGYYQKVRERFRK